MAKYRNQLPQLEGGIYLTGCTFIFLEWIGVLLRFRANLNLLKSKRHLSNYCAGALFFKHRKVATSKYRDQYMENTVTFLKAYGLKIFAGAILIWFGMVLEAYIAITSDPYLGFGILLFTVVVWMVGPARVATILFGKKEKDPEIIESQSAKNNN